MPLNEKIFSEQYRLILTTEMKAQLFKEARRRHVSAADLIRAYIAEGLVKSEGASKHAQKGRANLQKATNGPTSINP